MLTLFSRRPQLTSERGSRFLNREDHVWHIRVDARWICVLCGGVTVCPPNYPTPPSWMPDRYERLTDAERELCPNQARRA